MAWQVGARLHSFLHGLVRPSEAELVRQLWAELAGQFRWAGVDEEAGRKQLIQTIAEDVRHRLEVPAFHRQDYLIQAFVELLFDYEDLFVLPEVDWSRTRSIAELWEIREELTRQRGFLDHYNDVCQLLCAASATMLEPIYSACPTLLAEEDKTEGISVPTDLLRSLGNVGEVTQALLDVGLAEELEERSLLTRLRDRLERNLVAASGGNPADPASFNRAPKWPEQFDAKSPEHLVTTYLGGTPLIDLFDQELTFTIPARARFDSRSKRKVSPRATMTAPVEYSASIASRQFKTIASAFLRTSFLSAAASPPRFSSRANPIKTGRPRIRPRRARMSGFLTSLSVTGAPFRIFPFTTRWGR